MIPIFEGHPPQDEAFPNQNKGHCRQIVAEYLTSYLLPF